MYNGGLTRSVSHARPPHVQGGPNHCRDRGGDRKQPFYAALFFLFLLSSCFSLSFCGEERAAGRLPALLLCKGYAPRLSRIGHSRLAGGTGRGSLAFDSLSPLLRPYSFYSPKGLSRLEPKIAEQCPVRNGFRNRITLVFTSVFHFSRRWRTTRGATCGARPLKHRKLPYTSGVLRFWNPSSLRALPAALPPLPPSRSFLRLPRISPSLLPASGAASGHGAQDFLSVIESSLVTDSK